MTLLRIQWLPLALILAGCATAPGTRDAARPVAAGSPVEGLRFDDAECRGQAERQTGGRMGGAGARRDYEHTYVRCTYAKGQRTPSYGQVSRAPEQAPGGKAPSPGAAAHPPPPPGHPAPARDASPASEAAGAGNWYYCASAGNYYPYVRQCAEGWRAVQADLPLSR